MAVAGLYRRRLPSPPAIDFTSPEGKAIFREALANGTMEGFFQLIPHFQTQAEPSFCGLASLSVVLNALAIDPGRTWKGPWRWFDESMLECCEPLEKVKANGITFPKVACAGQCAGASMHGIHAHKSSLAEFRQHVLESSSSEDHHIIVSYDRGILGQTGTGHFSPLGGYHEAKDLALILDVARFKYPPHWVPLSVLWNAMNTIDPATGNWRGFLLATKPIRPPSVLFTLSCKDELWRPIAKYLIEKLPELLRSSEIRSTQEALSVGLSLMPGDVRSLVKWIFEVKRADAVPVDMKSEAALPIRSKTEVLSQLRKTPLYSIVLEWENFIHADCHGKCPFPPTSGEDLPQAVKKACCQGAAALSGILASSVKCLKRGSGTSQTSDSPEASVLVGKVLMVDGTQDRVEVLIPTLFASDKASTRNDYFHLHPLTTDLVAMLVLALPPKTWTEITNPRVQAEMSDAVSTRHLPERLRLEVENLREQLYIVHRWCGDDTLEDSDPRILDCQDPF